MRYLPPLFIKTCFVLCTTFRSNAYPQLSNEIVLALCTNLRALNIGNVGTGNEMHHGIELRLLLASSLEQAKTRSVIQE
jgi:hypothetical protein